MSEECCHRIGELLASLSNIPKSNATAKFAVLEECLALQAKQIEFQAREIEALQKWAVDADDVFGETEEILKTMFRKKAVSVEELEKENP